MKKILIAALTAAALAACAAQNNAPIQAQSLNITADTALSKIEKRESRTIAYYNAAGELATEPQAGGYYRNLLGRTKEGYAVIQDFYQDSQNKQTNAIIIRDDADLTNFDVIVTEGLTIWYSPNGEVKQFADVRNKILLHYGQYINNQLAFEEENLVETQGHRATFYYPNGKKMVVETKTSPAADMTEQFYNQAGTLILDTAKTPLPKAGEANHETIQNIIKQRETIWQEVDENQL